MTARRMLLLVIVVGGCASGSRGDVLNGDAPTGSPGDARPGGDAQPAADAKPATDAPADAPSGGGLDPDLSLPDPSGQVCTEPGRIGAPQCPSGQVCRYFTPTEGRCESCTSCGNLGASCSASNQCDILFVCFQGKCTNFCTLGTTECGPPADCLNIGHATRGACRP